MSAAKKLLLVDDEDDQIGAVLFLGFYGKGGRRRFRDGLLVMQ